MGWGEELMVRGNKVLALGSRGPVLERVPVRVQRSLARLLCKSILLRFRRDFIFFSIESWMARLTLTWVPCFRSRLWQFQGNKGEISFIFSMRDESLMRAFAHGFVQFAPLCPLVTRQSTSSSFDASVRWENVGRPWRHWFRFISLAIPAIVFFYFKELEGTPGYKHKLILIDSQWLVKTNGATFIFIEKLGNKSLPGQFWPCLSFSALRHGRKSWFLSLWTKAQASLLLWYEFVWWWGREIRFEWVSSAVTTVEDHALQFENN